MASLSISWSNIEGLRRYDNALKALGDKPMRQVATRAINRAGDQARTQVIRALVKQTGLQRKVVVKALKIKRCEWYKLEYRITVRGDDISLKYFAARETQKGVSAKPFNQRRIFAGTFLRGGLFPRRVIAPSLNGHVFERDGKARTPISKIKSGVILPREVVSDESAKAWQGTVARVLPGRVEHELSLLTKGVFD